MGCWGAHMWSWRRVCLVLWPSYLTKGGARLAPAFGRRSGTPGWLVSDPIRGGSQTLPNIAPLLTHSNLYIFFFNDSGASRLLAAARGSILAI